MVAGHPLDSCTGDSRAGRETRGGCQPLVLHYSVAAAVHSGVQLAQRSSLEALRIFPAVWMGAGLLHEPKGGEAHQPLLQSEPPSGGVANANWYQCDYPSLLQYLLRLGTRTEGNAQPLAPSREASLIPPAPSESSGSHPHTCGAVLGCSCQWHPGCRPSQQLHSALRFLLDADASSVASPVSRLAALCWLAESGRPPWPVPV